MSAADTMVPVRPGPASHTLVPVDAVQAAAAKQATSEAWDRARGVVREGQPAPTTTPPAPDSPFRADQIERAALLGVARAANRYAKAGTRGNREGLLDALAVLDARVPGWWRLQ